MHDKAGVVRLWRGSSVDSQKRKQEQTKPKKNQQRKDKIPPIRCPGRSATAEGSVTTQAGREHGTFITVLPSLEITQISPDILTDEPANKGTELLTC